MHIFYLSQSMLPSDRANSVNTVKMCEALQELGHQVTLIVPAKRKSASAEDIWQYYDVQKRFRIRKIKVPLVPGWLYLYGFYLLVFSWRHRNHIDLLMSRFPWGLLLTSLLKKKGVLDLHGKTWKANYLNYKSVKHISRLQSTKKISFNTHQLMTMFKADFVMHTAKHVQLQANSNGASIVSTAEKFSLEGNSDHFNVGYVGSLHQGRGIELILETAAALPGMNFHIAGGPEHLLRQYQNGRPANVFFYGHLPFRQTPLFRNACDVLLAPYQENVKVPSGERTAAYMSPIKLFEYMASAKAIIASDLPAIREVLNESNAILCAPSDSSRWISALKRLSQDHEVRERLGAAAHGDFLSKYTWTRRAEKIMADI